MDTIIIICKVIIGIIGVAHIVIAITDWDFFYEYHPRKRLCDYIGRGFARLIDAAIGVFWLFITWVLIIG